MRQINFIITSILIFSIFWGALSVSAQVKKPKSEGRNIDLGDITLESDPDIVFGRQKKVGSAAFRQALKKIAPNDAAAIEEAFNAQSLYLFGRFREATKEQFAAAMEKAKKASEAKYDAVKGKKAAGKPAPIKTAPIKNEPVKTAPPVKQDYVFGNGMARYDGPDRHSFFRNAAYSQQVEGPVIKKVETENGMETTTTQTKSADLPDSKITHTETVIQRSGFEDKSVSAGSSMETTLEVISKDTGKKVTEVGKANWSATMDVCPDAGGIVRGNVKAQIYKQTTINTGRDLGALTTDQNLDLKVTAYVNDGAEMTHFELEGISSEKTFGYDRALDHGLVEDTEGVTDGTKTINVVYDKGTPPSETEPNEYGFKRKIDITFGKVKSAVTYDEITPQNQQKMFEFFHWGLQATGVYLDMLMRTSISRWRYYGCVEVECTSAKAALKAREITDITAITFSKQDQSTVNADLKASGTESVTPELQKGTPNAIYTLTAPEAGQKAQIIVTSTSRRGIGIGSWEYEIPKPKKKPPVKPPVKKPRVDPAWKGSIKAVHTEKETKEGQPSGRMTAERRKKENRWEMTLDVPGTRDTTGGVVNNFHAQTEALYHGSDLTEKRYAPGKMSCGKSGIITSPEAQSFEIIEQGDGKQLLLVTIAVIGTRGYISFGSPGIQAERTVIRKYDTNCAAYNATNSSTHTDPRGVSIGSPSFDVEFQVDPASPDEIQGTKTVINHDGSETVYTWHLTRVE